jgi:hypothetical protein
MGLNHPEGGTQRVLTTSLEKYYRSWTAPEFQQGAVLNEVGHAAS